MLVTTEYMKLITDKNRNVRTSTLCVGDTVLVRQKKLNKLSTPFDPLPYTIVQMKGSMVTAKRDGTNKWITRNSSFFKKVSNKDAIMKQKIIDDDVIVRTNVGDDDNMIRNDGDNHEIDSEEVDEEELPRRNPERVRNRPQYLQDDIENLMNN